MMCCVPSLPPWSLIYTAPLFLLPSTRTRIRTNHLVFTFTNHNPTLPSSLSSSLLTFQRAATLRSAMNSREQPQPQQPPQPQPPNMTVGPTMYPSMLSPVTARFPFSSSSNNNPPPSEPLNNDTNDNDNSAFEALKPCALAASESSKKKRGRPRKYSPDGNIALGLGPTHAPASSADPPAKKHRGRPPGSGKKQMDALGIYLFLRSFSRLFVKLFWSCVFLFIAQEFLELVLLPMLSPPKLARYALTHSLSTMINW